MVARLNGFVTSVPRREVRGEAVGPKPMLYTFPFVPGLLALPVCWGGGRLMFVPLVLEQISGSDAL